MSIKSWLRCWLGLDDADFRVTELNQRVADLETKNGLLFQQMQEQDARVLAAALDAAKRMVQSSHYGDLALASYINEIVEIVKTHPNAV
jgi:hypothetical protein